MNNVGRLLWRYKAISGLFGLFIVAYIAQIFLIPVNSAALHKYHLSNLQYHETLLAIAIPYAAIWIIALVGYLRLKAYSTTLGESKDGKAFQLMTKGVFWFTLWLPLSTLLSTLGEYAYRNNSDFIPNVIRMEIYANLIMLIPAFVYVYMSSVELLRISKSRLTPTRLRTAVSFIAFSALYTFLVLEDSARTVPIDANTPATYYMPDWIIVTTVIIPRLILWLLGILAVQNIIRYRQKVPGLIYKKALKGIALGIGGVTTLIITLRCVQSLTNLLNKQNLAVLLVIIFALLIMMAVAYVWIAKGARQLQSIEEV